ncbi:putative protein S-acyltransferase 12 [Carex littledalei]|uniref:S-acyltransferase n=1 Tax=Carex littledalei TaxID=544730 RepID=A0A833VBM1_9POAL|nr:putative protein S-acyltransferase 12 [Carex littledalei]
MCCRCGGGGAALSSVNPFRLCTGLRALGYLMLPLVAAIAGAVYYAVIAAVWGPRIVKAGHVSAIALFIVILFHLLLVMLISCYLRVVFSDPGTVPADWRPPFEEDIIVQSTFPNEHDASDVRDPTSVDTGIRQCARCQNWKPPRCHHCSVCDRCVLKMDHHCVWVVNCVGARNYKFFLLFLVYTFLETALSSLALLPHFISFFSETSRHTNSTENLSITFIASILSAAFALSLLCFISMHVSLVLTNTTSIEIYEKKNSAIWRYDLGNLKYFEQVFGTKKWLWFFPLYSNEDLENISALHGLEFPTRANEPFKGLNENISSIFNELPWLNEKNMKTKSITKN